MFASKSCSSSSSSHSLSSSSSLSSSASSSLNPSQLGQKIKVHSSSHFYPPLTLTLSTTSALHSSLAGRASESSSHVSVGAGASFQRKYPSSHGSNKPTYASVGTSTYSALSSSTYSSVTSAPSQTKPALPAIDVTKAQALGTPYKQGSTTSRISVGGGALTATPSQKPMPSRVAVGQGGLTKKN